MKRFYVITAAMALAGMGASYMLVPRRQEVALMHFKDKKFEEAMAAYEQELAKGKLSNELASRMVDLYLQYGNIDEAVTLLEKYIAAAPGDISARKQLGTLYQYAQRPDDYLRNLEEMTRLFPSADHYLALSDIYNFNAQYDKQIAALRALVDMEKGSNPEHAAKLADLLASRASIPEAIAVLYSLRESHTGTFTFRETELLVSLLLDEKRQEDALHIAGGWKERAADTGQMARLANLLHYKGTPAIALKLLEPYGDEVEKDPALLGEYIPLLIRQGEDEKAYALLMKMEADGTLPPALYEKYLLLAAARGDQERVTRLLSNMDLRSLGEPQLLSLIELAAQRRDINMLTDLRAALPGDEPEASPSVQAGLAAALGAKDAAERMQKLAQGKIGNQQRLQLARICLRSKLPACAVAIADGLPEAQQLTDLEVAAAAEIYLEAGVPEKGEALLNQATEERSSPMLETVRVKYAAVRGDTKAVADWLFVNPDAADRRLLNDLYFLAINRGHPETAAQAANWLYQRYPSPETRHLLAYAYVGQGEAAKALELLGSAGGSLSEEEEAVYLTALIQLSATDPAYLEQLGRYAGERLQGDLSDKRKMALTYALVKANRLDIALPYVQELALKHGGDWAGLYAGHLDKQGRHAEAREFWVKLATQPAATHETRRQIAYTLLEYGYAADAEAIFRRLATGARAKSPDVEALLYVWGPRLNKEQTEWLARAMRGARSEEKAGFATHIGERAGSEAILALAAEYPEMLNYHASARAYSEALLHAGSFKAKQGDVLRMGRDGGRHALLREYARVAYEAGERGIAVASYALLAQLEPEHAEALRMGGQIAFSLADYSTGEDLLRRYVELSDAGRITEPEAYQAYFTLAEIDRRRSLKAALPLYQQALDRLEKQRANTAEAASKRAQSMIWLGREEEGLAVFREAIARHPKDKVLRADLVSMLIERKRHQDAREELSHPMGELQPSSGGALRVPEDKVATIRQHAGGRELVLGFTGSGGRLPLSAEAAEKSGLASYAVEGHRTLLIAARPGYRLEIAPDGKGLLEIWEMADRSSATQREEEDIALRYAMLEARIDLETGEQYAATGRLNALLPDHPEHAELLGYTASAENFSGNWRRAQSLLDTALRLEPENEDIAELYRDIRRIHAPHAMLDHEWIQRGDSDEHVTTFSGYVNAGESLEAGVSTQNNEVEAEGVRRADGRVGNFDGDRQRGELYLTHYWERGHRIKGSLFVNNDTLGAGVLLGCIHRYGETEATVEFRRPYWEFIEGVLDDATRDRAALSHMIRPSPRLSVRAGGGVNRYNVKDDEDVATTASGELQVIYQLYAEQPYLAVGYGIDAEYSLGKEFRMAGGAAYKPFPFVSREIHFVSLMAGYEFTERTRIEGLAGYGYDRLGGHGPIGEIRLTHELNDKLDVQLRAARGLDTRDGGDDVTRIGAYLRWRF